MLAVDPQRICLSSAKFDGVEQFKPVRSPFYTLSRLNSPEESATVLLTSLHVNSAKSSYITFCSSSVLKWKAFHLHGVWKLCFSS